MALGRRAFPQHNCRRDVHLTLIYPIVIIVASIKSGICRLAGGALSVLVKQVTSTAGGKNNFRTVRDSTLRINWWERKPEYPSKAAEGWCLSPVFTLVVPPLGGGNWIKSRSYRAWWRHNRLKAELRAEETSGGKGQALCDSCCATSPPEQPATAGLVPVER